MADILMDTQGEPTTPASGQIVVYGDTTADLLVAKNDNGLVLYQLPFVLTTAAANFTGTDVNTAQPIFEAARDSLTIQPGSYIMQARFHIHTTGTTSHQLGLLFGGTATVQDIGYQAAVTNAATEVTGAPSTLWVAVATVTNVTPATATETHHSVQLDGIVRISVAGTFIPQYQWSAAPGVAGATLRDSYFMLMPFGTQSIAAVGAWA